MLYKILGPARNRWIPCMQQHRSFVKSWSRDKPERKHCVVGKDQQNKFGSRNVGRAVEGERERGREMAEAAPKQVRLLFCGLEFPAAVEYTRECLEPFPHLVMDAWPREEVPEKISEYDICVVRMMRLDAALIERAKCLKLIVQFGVGLEGVDVEAATRAGIKVARIPSGGTGNALSCAEHAIYLLLGLLRDQKGMAQAISERRLGEPTGETLLVSWPGGLNPADQLLAGLASYGDCVLKVLIIGYGGIGKELALRLKVFGVRLLAITPSWNKQYNSCNAGLEGSNSYTSAPSHDEDDLIEEKGGTELLLDFASRADIVMTCCVLNPATAGMVNETFLTSMKKGARLVNVARGGLLDYHAVRAALVSGQLGGLALDVTWSEPFDPSDPILQYPNVLITPHVAGVTELSYRRMAKVIAESAMQLSTGQPMSSLEFVN